MYRALMLRGMACSSPDLQSAPAPQHDASLPLPCDEARKFANVIFCGSEISSDVQAALARDLQKFALAQVSSQAPVALLQMRRHCTKNCIPFQLHVYLRMQP